MKYDNFIFKKYFFDKESKKLTLTYSFDNQIEFNETYTFNFDFVEYNPEALDRALNNLFLMAGVSYYKAFIPENIKLEFGNIDKQKAMFFSRTYQKGLGEFFYVNKLSPLTKVEFPFDSIDVSEPLPISSEGILIGLGGGKDSLVIVDALKESNQKIATWSLNHKEQLAPLVERIGLNHFFVDRQMDNKLIELNNNGALNGHVPISAILACVGSIVAILTAYRDVVVGNEQTANEPTLVYDGVEINHQYSKTQTFEKEFQEILNLDFGDSIRYYSFLRPLSELKIAEVFARSSGMTKYKDVFSSCNKAYTMHSDHMFWCGECPKCAFIFLIFTPFVASNELESLWNGKNLLKDSELSTTYKNLLGISGEKPLDCVGEIKESRMAMQLAFNTYPELRGKYTFSLPENYDYKKISGHEMPEEIFELFNNYFSKID